MVPTHLMCNKHLLGEHVEIHMISGCILRGKSLKGYINNGLVNPQEIYSRHAELVDEMLKRGFNHNSQLPYLEIWKSYDFYPINKEENLKELSRRCTRCAKLIDIE